MAVATTSTTAIDAGLWKTVSSPTRLSALALLFIASMLNLVDRQIVGILAEGIKQDLRLTDTELGLLTGTAFGLVYAFLTIPMSRLADHVSRTRLVAIAVALWSALTICCGLATSFAQLVAARMGVGIGEAGSQSASTSLIVDYFPPRQRGLAMAIFFLSVPIGGVMGLALGAIVASTLGWRNAFFFAGAPGLLLAIVIWLRMRDPRGRSVGDADLSEFLRSLGIWRAIRQLMAIRSYRLVVLGSVAGVSIQNLAAAWLPVYFVRVHGMSLRETAFWMSVSLVSGGTIGSLGSGWACDRLRNRVPQSESLVLTVSLAIIFPALALTCLSMSKAVAVAGLIVTYLFAFAFLTPAVLLVQKAAPESMRAIAVGLMASVMNVISLTMVLPLIGWGSDMFTAAYGIRGLGYSIACSSAIALVGSWMFMLAGREFAKTASEPAAA